MTKIVLTPLENGLDYMESAVTHLSAPSPNARDLKYGALHLYAAIEVLLKSRLAHEHWSLAFKTVDKATEADYESASFESVGTAQAIGRLRAIANVDISEADEKRINAVSRIRNRFQHHGIDDTAQSIQAVAAGALDFLLSFVDRELRDGPGWDQVEATLETIRTELAGIEKLVDKRTKSLTGTLADTVVVECPICLQNALRTGDEQTRCEFCLTVDDPGTTAENYIGDILGISHYETVKHGGEWPLHSCPSCYQETLVEGVTATYNGTHGHPDMAGAMHWLCFACGRTWSIFDIEHCNRCGTPTTDVYDDGVAFCSSCTEYWLADD